MPEYRSLNDPPIARAARCGSIRDTVLIGFAVFALVRTSEAWAGDQAGLSATQLDPDPGEFRLSPSPAPAAMAPILSVQGLTEARQFSSTDFRPRKHTIFDDDHAKSRRDAPMLRGTTVWQRMAEYKSHDRVRLLTLWETSGSTISLQAGKKGDPSLQWNSRLLNRGGSTHGLLDQLFSMSLAHAGSGLRNATRAAVPTPASRQAETPAVAALKGPARD